MIRENREKLRERERERKRESERLVPKTATGSFLALIIVHIYPNNTPLFLEVTQRNLFPPTKRTKLEQREPSTQRSKWRTREPIPIFSGPSSLARNGSAWKSILCLEHVIFLRLCALLSHLNLMTTLWDNNVGHTFIQQTFVQLPLHISPVLFWE